MPKGDKDKIFVDADAFVSTINSQDSNHKKAVKLSTFIKDQHLYHSALILQQIGIYLRSFQIGV